MPERSIAVCQVLPCRDGRARVGVPQEHPRPELLHHCLGEVDELEEDARPYGGVAVYLLTACLKLSARSCRNVIAEEGFVTKKLSRARERLVKNGHSPVRLFVLEQAWSAVMVTPDDNPPPRGVTNFQRIE
jgi:hypothetical protein